MTFAATNAAYFERYKAREWTNNYEEVTAFGRDMVVAIFLVGIDDLQEYYEKPWHWQNEHAWWVANDRPDTWEMWDEGIDTEFEVTG